MWVETTVNKLGCKKKQKKNTVAAPAPDPWSQGQNS